MILIYRKGKNLMLNGPSTNLLYPLGSPFEDEVQNVIQAHGGKPEDYVAFRLHDVEDGERVQAIFAAGSATVIFNAQGAPIGAEPFTVERPSEPAPNPGPTLEERVAVLERAAGAGGNPGEKGIAKRLDNLDARISALEAK